MEKLNLDTSIRDKYFFFVTSQNDPVTKGNAYWRTGAFVGLPYSFQFRSPDDAEKSPLMVSDQQLQVDWSSEEGKKLASALVLSDNAKSFVIARDVNILRLFISHTEVFLQAAFVVIGYTAMKTLNKYLFLPKKIPNWSRYTALTMVGVSVLTIYMAAADMYSCSKDIRTDRKTAKLSKEFTEGGVEYYEKIVARNQAIRAVMGEDHCDAYTAEGDDVRTLRTPHLPFSVRLTYLKSHLDDYKQMEEFK